MFQMDVGSQEFIRSQRDRLAEDLHRAEAGIRQANADVRALNNRIAELEAANADLEAHAAGWKAAAEALKARLAMVAPHDPLLNNTNVKFMRGPHKGRVKSVLRGFYEKAFDAVMKKRGLDPLKFRD